MLSARPVDINVDGRVPVKGIATGSKTPGRTLLKSRTTLRENLVGSHTVGRVGNNNKHTPLRLKTREWLNRLSHISNHNVYCKNKELVNHY
jgi:hypothetical protein